MFFISANLVFDWKIYLVSETAPSNLLPPPQRITLSGKLFDPRVSIISCLISVKISTALSFKTWEICLLVTSNVFVELFCLIIIFSAILSFSGVQLVSVFNWLAN